MWRSHRFLASAALLAAIPLGQDPGVQDREADIAAGARIFRSNCAICHGRDATGGKGPNLAKGEFRYATSDAKFLDIVVNGIPGTGMGFAAWNRTSDEHKQLLAYVRSLAEQQPPDTPIGDPQRGEILYRNKGGCTECHRLNGQGGRRGPELDGIAWKRSRDFLRESIVDPSADVDSKWWEVLITDKSGNLLKGQLLDEDTYSIRFLDEQDELRSLLKSEIQNSAVRRGASTMVLKEALSSEEVDDLVAYLETLRGEQE